MSGDPVAAREWRAAMERVIDLVRDAGDAGLAVTVPACPGWTAHDLVAHMVGLGADVLRGHEPDDHDAAWTQAHVDDRAGAGAADLVAEWEALADDLERYVAQRAARPLLDAVIHEQDLRGALAAPGARDTDGVRLAREALARRLGNAVSDRPPVVLEADDWTWRSGEGEPGVVLAADGFELFRALTSRRTADQLRTWVVSGDVEPYLDGFAGLGDLPELPLPE